MHLKGANSMAMSGLGSRNALVGTKRAICVLFGTNGLRMNPLPLCGNISSTQSPSFSYARLTSSKSLD